MAGAVADALALPGVAAGEIQTDALYSHYREADLSAGSAASGESSGRYTIDSLFYGPFYANPRSDGYASSDYRLSPYGAISLRVDLREAPGSWELGDGARLRAAPCVARRLPHSRQSPSRRMPELQRASPSPARSAEIPAAPVPPPRPSPVNGREACREPTGRNTSEIRSVTRSC